jgi:hypothetical protein
MGAPKMISEPMVRSAQTMHLSWAETNTTSKRTENKLPLEIHYLGVLSGVPKAISMPVLDLSQTMHLGVSPNR